MHYTRNYVVSLLIIHLHPLKGFQTMTCEIKIWVQGDLLQCIAMFLSGNQVICWSKMFSYLCAKYFMRYTLSTLR